MLGQVRCDTGRKKQTNGCGMSDMRERRLPFCSWVNRVTGQPWIEMGSLTTDTFFISAYTQARPPNMTTCLAMSVNNWKWIENKGLSRNGRFNNEPVGSHWDGKTSWVVWGAGKASRDGEWECWEFYKRTGRKRSQKGNRETLRRH